MSTSTTMSKEDSKEPIDLEEGVGGTQTAQLEQNDTAEDESQFITGSKLYLINASLMISLFIVQLDSSIISTSIVSMTDDLGGYEKSSWLFTAFLITFCGLAMIFAKISDLTGRRIVLVVCLGVFTVASALCAAAQTIDQLIMFRWLQGAGGAGVYALVQLIFLEIVPRRKYPAYMSMVAAALAMSLVLGPLLGGGITLHGSWRWIFIINVPIGIITGVALWFTLPRALWNEPAAQSLGKTGISASFRRLDFLGAFLMVAAIVLLTTGLQEAAEGRAWSSSVVLGLLISSAPTIVAFFVWQWFVTTRRTNPEPVFPWRLCQSRRRMGMIINTFLAGAVQFVIVAQVPQRFVTVNNVSPLSAAARLLSFGAVIPVGSGIAGALMGGKIRIPPCYIVVVGSILELIGVALLSQISTAPEIDGAQYGYQVLAGFGTGMVNAALIILTPYLMEKRDLAVGTAANFQFRVLGGLIGLAIVVSVSTPYVRSRLDDFVSPEQVLLILQRTEIIKDLPAEAARQVRIVFGESYNLQIKIMIGFAAAKLPVTALMWTNQKSDV